MKFLVFRTSGINAFGAWNPSVRRTRVVKNREALRRVADGDLTVILGVMVISQAGVIRASVESERLLHFVGEGDVGVFPQLRIILVSVGSHHFLKRRLAFDERKSVQGGGRSRAENNERNQNRHLHFSLLDSEKKTRLNIS